MSDKTKFPNPIKYTFDAYLKSDTDEWFRRCISDFPIPVSATVEGVGGEAYVVQKPPDPVLLWLIKWFDQFSDKEGDREGL